MHVSGNDEIEFGKLGGDLGVVKINWRVDEGDFDLMFRKIRDEILIDGVEVGQEDI